MEGTHHEGDLLPTERLATELSTLPGTTRKRPLLEEGPFLKNRVSYQALLQCRRRDSNPRLADYDSAALTS